jgi:hypothetical protein
MNRSSARRAVGRTFAFLFVLVAAAGAQTYSIPASFDGTDGGGAFTTPLIDSLGNIFGTTPGGGSNDCGVVYELVNNGGGSYTNKTLYNFTGSNDGCFPYSGVLMDSAGNLYGTTNIKGAYSGGVVYKLVNQGNGSYKLEVIHAFSLNGNGGYGPLGDLAMFKGRLYGVTHGSGDGGCRNGCGTLYRLTRSGGKWVETVLHVFYYRPLAGVAIDSGGNLYGTLQYGGSLRYGAVFKLSPQSGGSYKETILHTFEGKADGAYPSCGVVLDSAGNLYGAAWAGGEYLDGTVYQLKRSDSNYTFSVILTFDGANGVNPIDEMGHLAVDSAGNVYGTAQTGGAYGYGTAFKLAAGSFLYTDLHDFNMNGMDGYYPMGGVNLDSLGNLYGTTENGGSNDDDHGTVWQIANP